MRSESDEDNNPRQNYWAIASALRKNLPTSLCCAREPDPDRKKPVTFPEAPSADQFSSSAVEPSDRPSA